MWRNDKFHGIRALTILIPNYFHRWISSISKTHILYCQNIFHRIKKGLIFSYFHTAQIIIPWQVGVKVTQLKTRLSSIQHVWFILSYRSPAKMNLFLMGLSSGPSVLVWLAALLSWKKANNTKACSWIKGDRGWLTHVIWLKHLKYHWPH